MLSDESVETTVVTADNAAAEAANDASGEAIRDNETDKVTNFRMNENMESLTISSKSGNHMNLVKLQKNKSDKTITLDILSCPLHECKKKRSTGRGEHNIVKSSTRRNISLFSFSHLFHEEIDSTNNLIHFMRTTSLIWIILLNVTTTLSYASSKQIPLGIQIFRIDNK